MRSLSRPSLTMNCQAPLCSLGTVNPVLFLLIKGQMLALSEYSEEAEVIFSVSSSKRGSFLEASRSLLYSGCCFLSGLCLTAEALVPLVQLCGSYPSLEQVEKLAGRSGGRCCGISLTLSLSLLPAGKHPPLFQWNSPQLCWSSLDLTCT